ncbi:amidohydrolase [Nocardia nova]|uniref:amidohydrolase family protein n=1 Tax=Nocardia nova TaxID=37330 RepID=UPI0025B17D33|nr:amidohydrolase family protein [Nocardia nova]MDN2495244.1 amidohydrolase [Nocardia nova]
MTTAYEAPTTAQQETKLAIIDSDVHPYMENGLATLVPYMSKAWQQRLGIGLSDDWAAGYATSQFHLPLDYLYINSSGGMRGDTARPGMAPATDPAFTAAQLLDSRGIDRAILLSGHLLGLGAMPDPQVAATIAAAYNDWMCERWLQFDRRYRGGLVIAPQDPELAVKEIDRVADRPGIVEIFMPLHDILMGEKHYYPIYEAAQRHGLPICVHPSGTENVYARAPRMAGTPTYYIEWHALLGQIHQANTASLLCHGVFERFPELKIVIAEGGIAWIAELTWKLDADWHGLRDEIPWVKRHPSDYLNSNMRFTTQPFVEPPKRQHLTALMDMINAEQVLMFSSDYPHWNYNDPVNALAGLPEELQRRIMFDTPREFYGDRIN